MIGFYSFGLGLCVCVYIYMYAQRIHTRLKVTIFISNTRIKALRHYSLPASSSPFSLFSSFCLKMEMKMWVGMVVMVCLFNIHIECKSILDNAQDAQLLCYFIFGDSLADNGNNNNLETKAKVDYFPYGIDYSDGHIGRFTNGRTIVDIIGFFSLIPFTNRYIFFTSIYMNLFIFIFLSHI